MATKRRKKRLHVCTLVAGVEGMALYINGYRVAGPKPWGGGVVRNEFTFDDGDLSAAMKMHRPTQEEARKK